MEIYISNERKWLLPDEVSGPIIVSLIHSKFTKELKFADIQAAKRFCQTMLSILQNTVLEVSLPNLSMIEYFEIIEKLEMKAA